MLRLTAQFFSVLFHPLLILTYVLALYLAVHPFVFGVSSITDQNGFLLLLQVFFATFLIPAVSVVIMRLLGLVDSLELSDRQQRIGPYIITGVFYLWIFRNFLGNPQVPDLYTSFLLGATIALFLAFFINIFSKISAHAVGMGGLLSMIVLLMQSGIPQTMHFSFLNDLLLVINLSTVFLIAIAMTGLVGASRLFLGAHAPQDLYGGLMIGVFSQIVAYLIIF